MAARQKAKLERLLDKLSHIDASVKDVPLLTADNSDQDSVDAVAGAAAAVISLTGPYALNGTPMVDACVRMGTHYCDLSGELQWVRAIAAQYHDMAAEAGVKIVHACGFECVPSDLSTYMLAAYMRKKHGRGLASVEHSMLDAAGFLMAFMRGGLSGGSWYSFMNMAKQPPLWERLTLLSPYCASPAEAGGSDGLDYWFLGWNRQLRMTTFPVILKMPNRRMVHRSNQLLHRAYGDDLHYAENVASGSPLVAVAGTLLTMLLNVVLVIPLLHPLLKLFVHRPGQGPSREVQLKGYWKSLVVAKSEAGPGEQPVVLYGVIGGARDPGYWDTARMVLESGLCLADMAKAGDANGVGSSKGADKFAPLRGGVLTPAAAMGQALLQRLQAAGIHFSVRD